MTLDRGVETSVLENGDIASYFYDIASYLFIIAS